MDVLKQNKMTYYTLEGTKPVSTSDPIKWGKWFEEATQTGSRIVKKSIIGEVQISTVFLGIDHALTGKPLLFETMIFGGQFDQDQWRYTTWEEAEKGHFKRCIEVLLYEGKT